MHESTDKLDKLASKCFDSFLRGIVEILCEKDGIHHVSDQIIAAKEFCRQLTSPSKSFARLQLKKWNNLDSQTKDYVKDKVSIENVVVVVAFAHKIVDFIHTITLCFS